MFFPLNNLTLARLYAYNIAVVFPNRDREGEPHEKPHPRRAAGAGPRRAAVPAGRRRRPHRRGQNRFLRRTGPGRGPAEGPSLRGGPGRRYDPGDGRRRHDRPDQGRPPAGDRAPDRPQGHRPELVAEPLQRHHRLRLQPRHPHQLPHRLRRQQRVLPPPRSVRQLQRIRHHLPGCPRAQRLLRPQQRALWPPYVRRLHVRLHLQL